MTLVHKCGITEKNHQLIYIYHLLECRVGPWVDSCQDGGAAFLCLPELGN